MYIFSSAHSLFSLVTSVSGYSVPSRMLAQNPNSFSITRAEVPNLCFLLRGGTSRPHSTESGT